MGVKVVSICSVGLSFGGDGFCSNNSTVKIPQGPQPRSTLDLHFADDIALDIELEFKIGTIRTYTFKPNEPSGLLLEGNHTKITKDGSKREHVIGFVIEFNIECNVVREMKIWDND